MNSYARSGTVINNKRKNALGWLGVHRFLLIFFLLSLLFMYILPQTLIFNGNGQGRRKSLELLRFFSFGNNDLNA